METIFFSIFQRFLPVIVFLSSSGKVFFNNILHSGWWKRIFWLVETVFLCSEVFPSSGNSPSGSSFFFNWNIFFYQSFIPASKNDFFVYWKQYFFYSKFFFYYWKILLKFGGRQILKTNHIPASENQYFSIFLDIF